MIWSLAAPLTLSPPLLTRSGWAMQASWLFRRWQTCSSWGLLPGTLFIYISKPSLLSSPGLCSECTTTEDQWHIYDLVTLSISTFLFSFTHGIHHCDITYIYTHTQTHIYYIYIYTYVCVYLFIIYLSTWEYKLHETKIFVLFTIVPVTPKTVCGTW